MDNLFDVRNHLKCDGDPPNDICVAMDNMAAYALTDLTFKQQYCDKYCEILPKISSRLADLPENEELFLYSVNRPKIDAHLSMREKLSGLCSSGERLIDFFNIPSLCDPSTELGRTSVLLHDLNFFLPFAGKTPQQLRRLVPVVTEFVEVAGDLTYRELFELGKHEVQDNRLVQAVESAKAQGIILAYASKNRIFVYNPPDFVGCAVAPYQTCLYNTALTEPSLISDSVIIPEGIDWKSVTYFDELG